MSATVHIMRGIPGSGKSTKARSLTVPSQICSADDYFMKDGKYEFKHHELAQAHASCLKKFIALLHSKRADRRRMLDYEHEGADGGHIDIVVDNTNLRLREFETYVQLAQLAGYEVKYHEFVPPFGIEMGAYVRKCADRNTHGVSANQCMRMASVFELRQ